ncbi:hypothetical protein [Corynebacterium sp.]|jgi:hypothetical protein|uniref:hypothetical protein n=1 Tax=Corynebacterium sp. TaxID=1720 RepID=UPI0025BA6909|nr:hypothetical protein [Corynebacterium sp.]
MHNDYEYGRASGLFEASLAIAHAVCDATDPALQAALRELRDQMKSTAEKVREEARETDSLPRKTVAPYRRKVVVS